MATVRNDGHADSGEDSAIDGGWQGGSGRQEAEILILRWTSAPAFGMMYGCDFAAFSFGGFSTGAPVSARRRFLIH
jgi:hypothetical protein